MRDWVAWHAAYDDPASSLSVRLRLVRGHLTDALNAAPPGPVRLLSLCAGQGHDVLGVLPGHPRRADVSAVLVEADPQNAALARRGAERAGLHRVQVREADAALPAGYADALPAGVLLLCGIFGNVSDADIQRTARAAPALCAPGATVIWTRHRRPPDLTPQIRAWFAASGFDEVAFDSPDTEAMTGVGVGRLAVPPPAVLPGGALFTFRSAELFMRYDAPPARRPGRTAPVANVPGSVHGEHRHGGAGRDGHGAGGSVLVRRARL